MIFIDLTVPNEMFVILSYSSCQHRYAAVQCCHPMFRFRILTHALMGTDKDKDIPGRDFVSKAAYAALFFLMLKHS